MNFVLLSILCFGTAYLMVSKLFVFYENYFLVKIFVFLDTPICAFFSNLCQFLEINYFLTQYYNRKGRKDLFLSYTTHITRKSRLWQAIWGPDLFSTKKVEKWPQDHYFSQKVLFYPFLTQYYNGKGKKIWTSDIPPILKEPHYCGKLSGVQIFLVQKKSENGLGIIIFHKKCSWWGPLYIV